jgi:hypothetical protein
MWNLCDGREPKVDFLVICSSVPPLNFPAYVFLDSACIARMLWRVRNSRGRPINARAAFIHPCQPIAKSPAREDLDQS